MGGDHGGLSEKGLLAGLSDSPDGAFQLPVLLGVASEPERSP